MPEFNLAAQDHAGTGFAIVLRDLCDSLLAFPGIHLAEADCEALVAAAIAGDSEAEFMIGSFFDAVEEPARAMEWYSRAASRHYLPAMLQLCALR